MAKYLGLDASTQSLSALIVESENCRICYQNSVNFGSRLPAIQFP